jgi:sorting nexin-29
VPSKGVRQGDALACLLFNIVLEKTARDAVIQTHVTMFYKFIQSLEYADDMDIIARSKPLIKEAFLALEGAARRMGLRINQEKTKYMITIQNAKQSKAKI